MPRARDYNPNGYTNYQGSVQEQLDEERRAKLDIMVAEAARPKALWDGRAYNTPETRNESQRIFQEGIKHRDSLSEATKNREQALSVENMKNIREEGINQRYLDAARIRRGDPVNAEGDLAGNYYDADGGLVSPGSYGGSGTMRGKKGIALSPAERAQAAWVEINKGKGSEGFMPGTVLNENFRAAGASYPEQGVASALKDTPGLVRSKIDPVSGAPLRDQNIPPGQFAPGPRTRENTIPVPGAKMPDSLNQLSPDVVPQGISTPYGNAPTGLSPAQWKEYADSRAVGRPDREMSYEGNQPGMVGDQIARFRRPDGAAFFANTGAAQMQAGKAGVRPGPDLEAMRSMRSGPGDPAFAREVENEIQRDRSKMNRFGKAPSEPLGDPMGPFDIAGRAIVRGMDSLSNMVQPIQPSSTPAVQGPPLDFGMKPGPGLIKNPSPTRLSPLTANMGGEDMSLSSHGIPPQFGESGALSQIDAPTWAQDYNAISSRNMPKKRMDFPWNTSASLPGIDEEAVRSKRKKARRSASY